MITNPFGVACAAAVFDARGGQHHADTDGSDANGKEGEDYPFHQHRKEGSTLLSERFEDQPWYPEWHAVVDRVVRARVARDSAAAGTPEREAADREYDVAFAAFRAAAERFRE
jgi:hypothetical protein